MQLHWKCLRAGIDLSLNDLQWYLKERKRRKGRLYIDNVFMPYLQERKFISVLFVGKGETITILKSSKNEKKVGFSVPCTKDFNDVGSIQMEDLMLAADKIISK